jgi:hypothetical protein
VEPIRVLIADDCAHFREGLSTLLLSAPYLGTAGKVSDGDDAVSLAAERPLNPPRYQTRYVRSEARGGTCRVRTVLDDVDPQPPVLRCPVAME